MIFNSYLFAGFFIVVFATYWSVAPRLRNTVLLAASYVFYGWWDWRFLFLLAASSLIDFTIAHRIHRAAEKRRRLGLLWMSVLVNLSFLGVFKYFNFFVESFEASAAGLGWSVDGPVLDVVLPVGISFYTFQTISYSFDVFRRRIEPTRRLLDFATYVAYFPQLVAGPIERAQRLLPRIEDQTSRRIPQGKDLDRALSLILTGLFKKVVLADGAAPIVNEVFADPDQFSALAILAAVLGFAIQIYGDFSGYTDMARGISELLGIDLVVNFREPYLSRNITEFWRRWHISLSNWLRDYLYIPLGGNRGTQLTTARNLMLTMLLGGLWHGASMNFLIWGGLHGTYLAVHKWTVGGDVPNGPIRARDLPRIAATLAAVLAAWVFFRAETLGQSLDVFSGLTRVTSGEQSWFDLATIAGLLLTTALVDLAQRRRADRVERDGALPMGASSSLAGFTTAAFIIGIVTFSGGAPQPFIYFQF